MKTQIKSLQQFNAHLDFISERQDEFKEEFPELTHSTYRIENVPVKVVEEIAEYYKQPIKIGHEHIRVYVSQYVYGNSKGFFVESTKVDVETTYKEA